MEKIRIINWSYDYLIVYEEKKLLGNKSLLIYIVKV